MTYWNFRDECMSYNSIYNTVFLLIWVIGPTASLIEPKVVMLEDRWADRCWGRRVITVCKMTTALQSLSFAMKGS